MRSVVELANRSPSDHELNAGSRQSIERPMPAQGFTSVNGTDRQHSAASSGALMEPSAESQSRSNHNLSSSVSVREDAQSLRRPAVRNDSVLCPDPAIKLSPDTAKRKRLMIETIELSQHDRPASAAALSPKRRMTDTRNGFHSNAPSGSTMNLLNTHVSIESATREQRCSRERSPVPTRYQRTAPPQVRPETEAHLAESLATHLQDVNNQTPANGTRASQDNQAAQDVSVTTRSEVSPGDSYSPGADPGDPHSKRKRNFSNRTKTGCHTCRTRKKKCDEAKPECNNCLRGGFTCTGYGPKPVEGHKGPNANNRAQVPLQSKVQDAPQRSPAPLSSDGPRYDHWGRIPPTPTTQEPQHRFPPAQSPLDTRHPYSRDAWRSSSWQHREPESTFPHGNAFPPAEYNQSMPPVSYHEPRPPQDAWKSHTHPSHFHGPPPNTSSNDYHSAHSSRNPTFAPLQSSEVSEKHKMLIGEPYKAHLDSELLDDRRSCMAAVERWNQAHQHSRATSDEEKGRLFKAILDPSLRPDPNYQYRESSASSQTTRPGSIGARVIIVSPFTCDYGYNIHIGDDAFIGANCTIEDAADISIGSRVHIGKNVLLCGTDEPASSKGSQADLTAGAIIIEDEVNIGAGTIVMPHRVIGKGASVAAGSVVTRNIPPYTFAAGNPCRVIRTLPRRDSRGSRELTAFTTLSGSVHSSGEEEHAMGDRQLLLENEASLRDMRARRGIREQGIGRR